MKNNDFKILKKQFDGKSISEFIYVGLKLAVTAMEKNGDDISNYQRVNKYLDIVLADLDGYKAQLKASGNTEELQLLEAAEEIMDLEWWKYSGIFNISFTAA